MKRTPSSPGPELISNGAPGSTPTPARCPLTEYAWRWLDERPNLRRRTQELYEGLLRLHVLPALGDTPLRDTPLRDFRPATIRTWHAGLLKGARPGASTAAKCYRLLRSILATAVEDELITKNPCSIRGAGVEHPGERPIATIEQVYAIADAIEPRYRALVRTATFTGLRLGELRALTRRRLDLLHATVNVIEQMSEFKHGELVVGPPKSEASKRTVTIPAALIPEPEAHLPRWAAPGPDGLVFCGTRDQPLRRASLYTVWRRAVQAIGVDELRFHDLRHTGNTLAAATGASTRELMVRMGHASPRAELIYQHATQERDRVIAEALSELITHMSPGAEATLARLPSDA
ncbi:MAG: site-specific integrase [Acidimicrobiia bacterium]